eukprot:6224437-Alexandrium_andersonii.AAC.1
MDWRTRNSTDQNNQQRCAAWASYGTNRSRSMPFADSGCLTIRSSASQSCECVIADAREAHWEIGRAGIGRWG